MMTANFARVFAGGARVWDAERDCTYTVEALSAGALDLLSGVAVLVDSSRNVDDLRAPAVLAHNVPAGRWATELSLVSPLGGDTASLRAAGRRGANSVRPRGGGGRVGPGADRQPWGADRPVPTSGRSRRNDVLVVLR